MDWLAFVPSSAQIADAEFFAILIGAIALALILERYVLDRFFDRLAARQRDLEPRRREQLHAIVSTKRPGL